MGPEIVKLKLKVNVPFYVGYDVEDAGQLAALRNNLIAHDPPLNNMDIVPMAHGAWVIVQEITQQERLVQVPVGTFIPLENRVAGEEYPEWATHEARPVPGQQSPILRAPIDDLPEV